jgi:hypothetical protein
MAPRIRNTGRNFFVQCVPDPDSQRCQVAVVTATFQKCGRFNSWIVAVKVAVSALNGCEEVVKVVVGKIYNFIIFKAFIFWEKVKVSLAFKLVTC